MQSTLEKPRLKMMARRDYPAPQGTDPLRWYYWPVLGRMYRGRVELCLRECRGGCRAPVKRRLSVVEGRSSVA